MTRTTRTILFISVAIVLLVIGGGIYFVYTFLTALAPANIKISKTEISTSDGFINPITIEKIIVDSLGSDSRPIKYTVKYLTTCSIKQAAGKPPIPLKKIKLSEKGRYSWCDENVDVKILHSARSPQITSSGKRIMWATGDTKYEICPLKFENDSWYFITFFDPQIVGIYVYVDKLGDLHQFNIYSGVSPI